MIILFFRLQSWGGYWRFNRLICNKDPFKETVELGSLEWFWSRDFNLNFVLVRSYTDKPD